VTGEPAPIPVSYVIALKWQDDSGLDELVQYLKTLRGQCEVLVVDGSPEPLFSQHARAFEGLARHLAVDPAHSCLNGKVAGVHTGIAAATHEAVVLADDDVRYGSAELAAVAGALTEAQLVRPVNVFNPLPWHARWDCARTLLNCAVGNDYPGTLAVRRSAFLGVGGYDGDVLFENLELIRTLRAHGAVESTRHPVVDRLPPSAHRFWQQRVRQAYDSFAQPPRLAAELALLPALFAFRRRAPLLLAATAVLAACLGRRRVGAGRIPASVVLWAPCWVLERGVCSWLAAGLRLRGGVRYAGSRIKVAAHSNRRLRRQAAGGAQLSRKPTDLWEPSQNGLIAEAPQRHSATTARVCGMSSPSRPSSSTGPRHRTGPSG
jgi:hypothetical protein